MIWFLVFFVKVIKFIRIEFEVVVIFVIFIEGLIFCFLKVNGEWYNLVREYIVVVFFY